ncbi:PSD1 and planctomycete cytochrome C domain-containing protein [Planctomyces sp. SH-PL14]|uniref:PSD1 and planctomycete cytochrome C domain-containing protein n=1 Tax=Planctomyces sp. SH-PL14 TaxID=1632864 RepID=UPI0018D4A83F|nr:PSD1 and planctomycete cytochrome C domain-containing protein [Planctomyces sp. SH-PL14]
MAIGTLPGQAAADPVDYLRDIKPLLRSRCVTCHGAITQEAGLRVDAAKLILKGSDEGPVALAGKSRESSLIARISSTDPDERMPPKGAPLTPAEIATLAAWIDSGAPAPADEPMTPSPREHWSFQPLRPVPVPAVRDASWSRNPIDRFVLSKLESRGWTPNPDAPPAALMRRAYLDLHGLPPTPAEQKEFLATADTDAYDRLVTTLLSQPAFGERYARHWLDVVRYADSNGYERDAAKPDVWRYRDYVIRAMNEDLPFDRFLLEQVAGDELADADFDSIVATGFHRLGPWDDEPADPTADRFDQLDDIVNTTSQSFLALTMGCARCHDHKFDPLTQRDYYSLVSIFNPLARPQNGRTELTLPAMLPGARRQLTDDQKKAAPQGYFFEEKGTPPKTHILLRGSPGNPGDEVAPAMPAILLARSVDFLSPGEHSSRRRLTLAEWLVERENPLTARVIVNRVWQWHFGEGLVRTSNDFGLNGERPTHPELLDYLAGWFVHEADWSLKKLHHLIMTSRTYQQSRAVRTEYEAADPENRLLWRRSLQRLEVEPIRDSILAVSGQLDRTLFGQPMYPLIPREALESHADKTSIWPAYNERAAARRTVYAFTKRSLLVPLLEVLDLCDTTRSSPRRNVTTVPTQALTLFNSDFVLQQARHLADRLQAEAGDDLDRQIDLAWQLALARAPRDEERQAMRAFVADEIQTLRAERGATATEAEVRQAARVQLCRVLFNLNEFVYPE